MTSRDSVHYRKAPDPGSELDNHRAPAVAVAVGAHPDDIEIGCGATLAKWAERGCLVHHIVCTDGSKGSWDPAENVPRLVEMRREEQRAAARALGGRGKVIFLGWMDGELEAGLRERRQLCAWIRELRPEVVMGHDPFKRYRLHPDHRNAGFLTLDAVVAARDPLFFPGVGGPAHRPDAIYLWEAEEVNHVEDVSDTLGKKIDALGAHRSQLMSTMGIADPNDRSALRAWVTERAKQVGRHASLDLGEAFHLITDT